MMSFVDSKRSRTAWCCPHNVAASAQVATDYSNPPHPARDQTHPTPSGHSANHIAKYQPRESGQGASREGMIKKYPWLVETEAVVICPHAGTATGMVTSVGIGGQDLTIVMMLTIGILHYYYPSIYNLVTFFQTQSFSPLNCNISSICPLYQFV